MQTKELPCATCKMKTKYENGERGLFVRLWHWHLGFCPGWNAYMKGLPAEEQEELIRKYDIRKK